MSDRRPLSGASLRRYCSAVRHCTKTDRADGKEFFRSGVPPMPCRRSSSLFTRGQNSLLSGKFDKTRAVSRSAAAESAGGVPVECRESAGGAGGAGRVGGSAGVEGVTGRGRGSPTFSSSSSSSFSSLLDDDGRKNAAAAGESGGAEYLLALSRPVGVPVTGIPATAGRAHTWSTSALFALVNIPASTDDVVVGVVVVAAVVGAAAAVADLQSSAEGGLHS